MDGRIHVLPASEPLPHTQAFYDEQAASQSDELLSDGQKDMHGPHGVPNSPLGVTAGFAEIAGTAGGTSTIVGVRFSHENIQIHAGKKVKTLELTGEWTDVRDPEILARLNQE